MKIKLNKFYKTEKDGVHITLTDSPSVKAAVKKRKRTRKIVGWSIFSVLVFALIFNLFLLPLSAENARVGRITSYNGDNAYICFDDTAMISAHRAGGDLAPEETLAAFELCVTATEYAVDILEFDLHLTKDGVLVLLHDDTVDRTSDARIVFGGKNIEAKSKTYEELRRLNFGYNFQAADGSYPYREVGADLSKVRILSLDEILTYIGSVRPNMNYIIEIKDGGETGERAMDILYTKLEEYGITERTIVGTFKGNVTKHIDKNYPQLTRSSSITEVLNIYYAFLYGVKLDPDKLGYDVLQIPYKFAMFNLGTQAFVDYAHSLGLAVQYWTINDPEDIRHLVSIGADAIITDNPEVAYNVIH